MHIIKEDIKAKDIRGNLELILLENTWLLKQLKLAQIDAFISEIKTANAIFIIAAGRSGFSMQSAAMRLMHLGFTVYFVGETTTPAIKAGDLLIAASGSGTTSTIISAAEKAIAVGAKVVALSTQEQSPLAKIASLLVHVAAAEKQDHNSTRSAQYAGSLFEQFLLLLTDAIFQTLWQSKNESAEEMWERHANLE
ncbi:6-phospho-3-hexuloisomerase [Pedobacter immunditicola]|uniref:6-phospho-3-hexuloisomerase n=1 Tax=Pedobacter immunditicola TaxID=3133440 RepID=UPI0030A6E296